MRGDLATGEGRREEFIREAIWHGSLEKAEAVLAAEPGLRSADVHIAAILGDDEAVRRFIAADPACVRAKSGPYGGDALNYLGLSKYLRLHPERTPAFVRAATALLEAGADPNTGFWTTGEFPEYESAMYGAAGVAHNPDVTRLLLERGADPNDGEVVYHTPESDDNRALELVVGTGRLTKESLAMMLIRKLDWHDLDGLRFLLANGAPANGERKRGWLALHHALARGNGIDFITELLDHGADPASVADGLSTAARAAREGRNDVLAEFTRRGIPLQLEGVDALIAACARDDAAAIGAISAASPGAVKALLAIGPQVACKFAGIGNAAGLARLLDLGVSVFEPWAEGDGYFGEARDSLPIHVAAWRAHPGVVRLLIERGSPVDTANAAGETPLVLAVRACVDSYWSHRRTPESVAALLAAGASRRGVKIPCGYVEVDALLQ